MFDFALNDEVKWVDTFESYDFLIIPPLKMRYPILTQFGQQMLAKWHVELNICKILCT